MDCRDQLLHTLQDAAAGKVPDCSVAAAAGVFPYGTHLCIPVINEALGRQIDFRVVDVGNKKYFQGRGHLDICVADAAHEDDELVNQPNALVVMNAE